MSCTRNSRLGSFSFAVMLVLVVSVSNAWAITIDAVQLLVDSGDGNGFTTVTNFLTPAELQAKEGTRFDFDIFDYGFGDSFQRGEAGGFIEISEGADFAELTKGLFIINSTAGVTKQIRLGITGHWPSPGGEVTQETSLVGELENTIAGASATVNYDLAIIPFLGHLRRPGAIPLGFPFEWNGVGTIEYTDGKGPIGQLRLAERIDFLDLLILSASLPADAEAGDFSRTDFSQSALERVTVTAVPEPTSLLLLGCGTLGLIAKARRRRNRTPNGQGT